MEYLAILLVFFLLNVVILVLGLKKKRIMLLFSVTLWFIVGLFDCHFLRFLLFKYTLSRQKHGELASK
ncbi:hypothetical protein I8F96_08820 [Enterococcus casseliflavus]|nr:hypothetical protein [Enterococcus casseliflavus]